MVASRSDFAIDWRRQLQLQRSQDDDNVPVKPSRSHVQLRPSGALATADAQLLDRIRQGDEVALDALMARYWSELHAYLDHILQNPDVAEDLVQETFVRLWARREQWELAGSLRGLVFQIGRRLALDERKSIRRRLTRLTAHRSDPAVPTPVDLLERGELEQAFSRALGRLPERRRLTFLMARWEGLSHREIAAALGISIQTVANQVTTALADLRTALRPFIDSSDR